MGTKLQELRDGCFYRALDNEPMFVLLARDPHAPALVRAWCEQREAEIAAGKRPASDMEQVQEARDCARRMMLWREEHNGEWRRDRLPLDEAPASQTDEPQRSRGGSVDPASIVVNGVIATPPELPRCGTDKAPPGWTCTRYAGHDGPCAAVDVDDPQSRYYRAGSGVATYPGDHTRQSWTNGPALESFMRAADLPED